MNFLQKMAAGLLGGIVGVLAGALTLTLLAAAGALAAVAASIIIPGAIMGTASLFFVIPEMTVMATAIATALPFIGIIGASLGALASLPLVVGSIFTGAVNGFNHGFTAALSAPLEFLDAGLYQLFHPKGDLFNFMKKVFETGKVPEPKAANPPPLSPQKITSADSKSLSHEKIAKALEKAKSQIPQEMLEKMHSNPAKDHLDYKHIAVETDNLAQRPVDPVPGQDQKHVNPTVTGDSKSFEGVEGMPDAKVASSISVSNYAKNQGLLFSNRAEGEEETPGQKPVQEEGRSFSKR